MLHLQREPLCRYCEKEDVIVPATVVDHIVPHRGDQRLFWNQANWQSLCKWHHDKQKKLEELSAAASERKMPDLSPSGIPVVMVCGPAGSGKSTYVEDNRSPNDLVIDLDLIISKLSGRPIYQGDQAWLERGLVERNRRLANLSTLTSGRAWFIIAAPDRRERDAWASMLRVERVHVMDTPLAECERRILADSRRDGRQPRMIEWAREWFQVYDITL